MRAKFSISKTIFNLHKSFWCQTVAFNSSFNILKVPYLLTIINGSFQDGVQDGCRELKFSIFKTIFNLHKSFWCQTVGFNSSFNILKVPFFLTIIKRSFSRWRPRWLPRAKILYIQDNIKHTQVFL